MNIYAINTFIFYVGKARNYNVPDVLNIISLHGAITIDDPGSNDICVKTVIIHSYARGEVHENGSENEFSLLRPFLVVFRGISKHNLPGYIGFYQFLRNYRKLNAFQQTSLILQALLEPALSQRIKDGDFVKIFDRFNLLHTVIN